MCPACGQGLVQRYTKQDDPQEATAVVSPEVTRGRLQVMVGLIFNPLLLCHYGAARPGNVYSLVIYGYFITAGISSF